MKVSFKKFLKHKKVSRTRERLLQPWPVYGLLIIVTLFLYLIKLTTLVPFGLREQARPIGSASHSQIAHDVLYAPTKVLEFLILKVSNNDAWIRLGSVVAVLMATLLLYTMLRKWHTTRISLLATALFACSSWVLHAGRAASHEVLFLWVVPMLLLSCLWFLSKQNDKKLPFVALMLGVMLYIPGSWLLILCGVVAFRKYIIKIVQKISRKTLLICTSILVTTIAPLMYSFIGNKSQVYLWLGYDPHQEFTLPAVAHHFVTIANQLFWHGPTDGGAWVVGTPILDIFSITMLVLGVYAYRAGYYPAREKLVFGLLILIVLIIGLGNVASIGLLLPLVYIFIANGLAYMLQSWFTVFPKNPVARPLGVGLLAIVVTLSCAYNLQRYFVVWPNVPATKQALNQQR